MILVYRSVLGARKISQLPCSLQTISQNGGFEVRGGWAIPAVNFIS